MFCGICGKEISDTSKFCPYCGGKVTPKNSGTAYENSGTAYGNGGTSHGNGGTAYENGGTSHGNGGTAYENNGTAYENSKTAHGYTEYTKYEEMPSQSGYPLADMPLKQKRHRKKRPFWLAAICTSLSVLFAAVLFSLCLTLLYCTVFSRAASGVIAAYSSKSTNFSEIPVGQIVNKFDGSGDYDDDVTLSQYIYDKLPAKDQENTTEEDIAEMIDDPSISEFVSEVMDDYMNVMAGKTDEASISNDTILQVIEENEQLVETAIGRELSEADYQAIESKLEEVNFEENTVISNRYGNISKNLSAIKAVRLIYNIIDNPTQIFVGLGISIGMVLFIILLLNLHKPYVIFRYLGVCTVLAAGIGCLTGVCFDWAFNELDGRVQASFNMILALLGNPQNRIMTNSVFFLIAGIGLIAVYIIIAVLLKTLSGRRA